MWANYSVLIGVTCVVAPILISIFLISKERYRSGWLCLLLLNIFISRKFVPQP